MPVDPHDDTVQAQAAEVVGQAARGHGVGRDAQQARQQDAQIAVGKPRGEQPEDHQGAEQRLHARVGEAQGRHALPVDHRGVVTSRNAASPIAQS